jgi:hypothetical protein
MIKEIEKKTHTVKRTFLVPVRSKEYKRASDTWPILPHTQISNLIYLQKSYRYRYTLRSIPVSVSGQQYIKCRYIVKQDNQYRYRSRRLYGMRFFEKLPEHIRRKGYSYQKYLVSQKIFF